MSASRRQAIELERWRQAVAAAGVAREQTPSCPASESLWEAARGDLGAAAVREILDHATSCPSCSLAWRLAAEVETEGAATAERSAAAPGSARFRPWALAAAAGGLLLALGIVVQQTASSDREEGEELRAPVESALRSELDEARYLPRNDFVLRWTPVTGSVGYSILVGTEDLDVVARADGLELASYRVPIEALSSLATGTRLVWRVEARLEDGSRLRSPSFLAVLE